MAKLLKPPSGPRRIHSGAGGREFFNLQTREQVPPLRRRRGIFTLMLTGAGWDAKPLAKFKPGIESEVSVSHGGRVFCHELRGHWSGNPKNV
jgi:hypothetical protein